MRILSVDDSSVIRKIMRGAAEVLGYELAEAADGFEGLTVLEERCDDIELILLDWNMPGMNGIEFLENIKADDRFKHIPVMMVTTETEKENIVRAIRTGAAHYMVKPFTMEELTTRILESLGQGG
ncbi:MAG: response regulator [Acidobacteriota bacterium]